ncbi:ABC transporter ATP-binding protein [Micromonospora sp. NPDC023644]|uniref:ABC transporter ATP-binding protein n=1 Tax=Micromonospora sp. NPDC023644 TaxID=3154321 RepID=UPI0033E8F843
MTESVRRLRSLAWCFRQAFQTAPAVTSLALLLAVTLGILPILLALAIGWLVGSVAAGGSSGLVRPLVTVAVLGVVQQALTPLLETAATVLHRRFDGHLRQRTMELVSASSGIAQLDRPDVQDDIAAIQQIGNTGRTPGGALRAVVMNTFIHVKTVAGAALAAWYSPLLAVVILVGAYAARGALKHSLLLSAEAEAQRTQHTRRAVYLRGLALEPHARREVRLFGLFDLIRRWHSEQRLTGIANTLRRRAPSARRTRWSFLAAGVAELLFFADLGRAYYAGDLTIGEVSVAIQAGLMIAAVINASSDDLALAYGLSALPAYHRLEQLTASAASVARPAPGHQSPPSPAAARGARVELRDVTFQYPHSDTAALAGVSLTIRPGTTVALLGLNGAGKSTLVKLVAGLYEPTTGEVSVDGESGVDGARRRAEVAGVLQEPYRMPLSLGANVTGRLDPDSWDDAVGEALRDAGLGQLLTDEPDGLRTVLSREYGGIELSGGQWQRVAIARALYRVRAGARLLLLDEPSSHLDALAERAILRRVGEVTDGVTKIYITHRLGIARYVDEIFVLRDGRLVENGSHDELMALGGHYHELFVGQAALYGRTGTDVPVEVRA